MQEEEVLSGQELVDGCSEGYLPGKPNQYCMQYMFGLVQALAALQEMEPGNNLFCIDPTVIGLEEVTDNVTKWMNNVPDRLNEDALNYGGIAWFGRNPQLGRRRTDNVRFPTIDQQRT